MYSNNVLKDVLKVLSRGRFERMREKVCPFEQDRGFTHWSHLVSLIYAQISGLNSLRSLEAVLKEQQAHHYHLGISDVKRSTLSNANNTRSPKLFEEVLAMLTQESGRFGSECREVMRIIDSSPIHLDPSSFGELSQSNGRCCGIKLHLEYDANTSRPLCFDITPANQSDLHITPLLSLLKGATYVFDRGYMKFVWWQKLADAGCRFVTRMQKSVSYEIVKEQKIKKGSNVLRDRIIKLTGKKSSAGFLKRLRVITVQLENSAKTIDIVSNDLRSDATKLAGLYKRRWEIELLFKWIKQNLKIKKFIGRSENAVRFQIITALITFVLIGMYKKLSAYQGTLSQLLLVIRANAFQRMHHKQFFERRKSLLKTPSNQLSFSFLGAI